MFRTLVHSVTRTDFSSQDSGEKPLPTIPLYRRVLTHCKHAGKSLVRSWWAWELLASSVSVVATIALVAVLQQANGRAQKSWTVGKTQLTLNAIIAAISTVIRASILLANGGALNQSLWNSFSSPENGKTRPARPLKDVETFGEAAADSWSSSRLLWRTKGCNLAALGAAVLISSLVFDAFTQQLLTIEESLVKIDSNGLPMAADNLLPRSVNFTNVTPQAGNLAEPRAPLAMKGAIMSSVLNSNGSLPIGRCPTGFCSWPETPSLAICSSCNTMTLSTLQKSAKVTYSAPWGDLVNDHYDNVDLVLQAPSGPSRNINISRLVSSIGHVYHEGAPLPPIISFYLFGIPPANYAQFSSNYSSSSFPTESFLSPLVTAYNCSLTFCVQSFAADMTAGQSHQYQVATWNQSIAKETWSGTFVDVPSGLNMSIENASAYQIDSLSSTALGVAFEQIMTGSVRLNDITRELEYLGTSDFGITTPSIDSIDSFSQVFYEASDSLHSVSALAQQIATGMTNYLRTSAPTPLDLTFAPSIFHNQPIVRVRWAWLTFPLGLLATSQLFLFATIWQTARRRVRPWNSKRLPLLLASMDHVIKRSAEGGFETRRGLEERVGRTTVTMDFDDRNEISFRKV